MAEVLQKYVGRLAPSPTGALHLGNVRTFMIAWLRARQQNGKVIMRMEDLDHPRDKPGAAAQAIEDLKWLGFDWDEEFVQSERKDIYRAALGQLQAKGMVYACTCTRRDVEAAQSAPHAGEQLFYPGTCCDKHLEWTPKACWRFKTPKGSHIIVDDVFAGKYEQTVDEKLGDFPLARDQFGAGYTLAAVVDDALMGVTEIVRGDDLLPATPAQMLVQHALNLPTPQYCHVPLLVGPDGRRLAKRHGDTRISNYRAQGVSPEVVIGGLAVLSGWLDSPRPIALDELIPVFSLAAVDPRPLIIDNQGTISTLVLKSVRR